MKKFLALILTGILAISFCACGSENASESTTGVKKRVDQVASFNSDAVLDNLSTTSYTWDDKYSGKSVALIIKNDSEFSCMLNGAVTFKDASGNIVGSKDDLCITGAGAEVCMVFSNETPFETFDYKFTADELFLTTMTTSLTCEPSIVEDKVIVSMTNNNPEKTAVISTDILLYQGDQIVGNTYCFFDDIPGGDTSVEEANAFVDFDNVKVFYTAYEATS